VGGLARAGRCAQHCMAFSEGIPELRQHPVDRKVWPVGPGWQRERLGHPEGIPVRFSVARLNRPVVPPRR